MFPYLRIIDLSYNAFSKELPESLFQHLKGMRTIDQEMKEPSDKGIGTGCYEDSVVVVTKGLELEVVRILSLYTVIDLSSNRFEGHTPSIVGDLIAVRLLNLYHNGLQGRIPPSLGSISALESLDLSFNQISREIPQQLASLTSLEFLNLSHNHLRGCIPQGPQLQTFESNAYKGNDGLRGFLVSKGCGNDSVSDTNNTESALDDQESNSESFDDFWKGALMGYGCGLCIGLSIAYFMMPAENPKWLARIVLVLEHRMRKKQRR
ncbi:putative elongator complex protein 2-like [Capsicum annuum]|nr:putative elongator complex protein 2-like [Capsicum annuum]